VQLSSSAIAVGSASIYKLLSQYKTWTPSLTAKSRKMPIRVGALAYFIYTYTEYHRVHISTRDVTGLACICSLSWSVHCNFTGDGECSEKGRACTPHPHQPGLILPSWSNVRQKATVATLCTLCSIQILLLHRIINSVCLSPVFVSLFCGCNHQHP
jgi:hypothetical protein